MYDWCRFGGGAIGESMEEHVEEMVGVNLLGLGDGSMLVGGVEETDVLNV